MWPWCLSHSVASEPIVDRPAVESTYSPRALDTSTDARKSSASRFVVNPRLSVCARSGFRYRAVLASSGHTVAYLAGGVDRFYPSGHDTLLSRIVEAGVVASELPCGAAPTKWRFLMRNRLIAASTKATVVVEAGWRSGSLNTAGHAFTLGRPLGAVPGPVTSAASAGCHRLIRECGAIVITNADEAAEL